MSKKLLIFITICGILISSIPAYAWGRERGYNEKYRYDRGHYWLGGAIVSGLITGAIIESLNQPKIVVISGTQYYYDGNYYYLPNPSGGYIVVNPVSTVISEPYEATVVVEGSSIILIRKENGFIGPDGQYFKFLPTGKQLRTLYGK